MQNHRQAGVGEPGQLEQAASKSLVPFERALLWTVDGGIAAVLFIAPMFLGGRHPLGQFVLVAIVAVTFTAWMLRQACLRQAGWRWSGVEWLLLAGLALLILQLIPLPASVLQRLSPSLTSTLPLWTADSPAALGRWSQISLTPAATRGGLVMFASYALLFLLLVQRLRTMRDLERLLQAIALAAVAMASVGLAQFLFGNGKFLWVYEHPYRDTLGAVKGPFHNQNHFAHFLALGIGPLVWWLERVAHRGPRNGDFEFGGGGKPRAEMRHVLMIALGIVAFAGLLSFSRGGIIVMLLATIICVAIYVWARLFGRNSLLALAASSVLVGAALFIYGYEPLARELGTLNTSSLDGLNQQLGRSRIWNAVLEAVPHYAAAGSGVGSHREVYRTYFEDYASVEYTHAESGYLQVLLETGVSGMVLFGIGLLVVASWCVRSLWRADSSAKIASAGAIFAGIVASIVHSVGDFVWYIPACMSLTVVLAACACRLVTLGREADARARSLTLSQPAWVAAGVVSLGLMALLVVDRWGPAMASRHWDRYLRETEAAEEQLVYRAGSVEEAAAEQAKLDTARSLSTHLERALAQDPQDARANLRMAALCLRRFDLEQKAGANAMELVQIRDAALASKFESRQALNAWLDVAIGENRKLLDAALFYARRGLGLCPLQGEGYVYLAELGFLEGRPTAAKQAFIEQALLVRPYSGTVMFAAGGESALEGNIAQALGYWKTAFHHDPEKQQQIIELLAPQLPAEFFLSEFEPQRRGLSELFSYYRRSGRLDDARKVGRKFVVAVEEEARTLQGVQAAEQWRQAYVVYDFLEDAEGAVASAQHALQAAPEDFAMHRLLAQALLRQGRYAAAAEQLQWCLHRRPEDADLKQMLATARRGSLQQSSTVR